MNSVVKHWKRLLGVVVLLGGAVALTYYVKPIVSCTSVVEGSGQVIPASVYLSFAISGLLGVWLRTRKNIANTLGVTLFASAQFYLLTNFAVWAFGTLYPKTAAGLLSSYINALPFFRNTLLGDV